MPECRHEIAAEMCKGKRVMDIGGSLMPDTSADSPFARMYTHRRLQAAAYHNIDVHGEREETIDFNCFGCGRTLRKAMSVFQPQVILCMEFLEHVHYHAEVMDAMAWWMRKRKSEVRALITLPAGDNWVTHQAGWHLDHLFAFTKGMAERFIRRSPLKEFPIHTFDSVGKWHKAAIPVWVLAGFRPISYGFVIG